MGVWMRWRSLFQLNKRSQVQVLEMQLLKTYQGMFATLEVLPSTNRISLGVWQLIDWLKKLVFRQNKKVYSLPMVTFSIAHLSLFRLQGRCQAFIIVNFVYQGSEACFPWIYMLMDFLFCSWSRKIQNTYKLILQRSTRDYHGYLFFTLCCGDDFCYNKNKNYYTTINCDVLTQK